MKFYIVRHGQTLFNVQGKIQGWCDSPLTELGIEQAEKRAELLKDVDFVAAFSSTQERAVDTCHILMNGRDIPYAASKAFKEMNFGIYEGESGEEVFTKEVLEKFETYFEVYGGENAYTVSDRFLAGLIEAGKQFPTGNILVTAHGGSIMRAIKVIDEDKYNEIVQGEFLNNCALCVVEYDGRFKLLEVSNERL